MTLIFFLLGFVLGATSCSDQEFHCGMGHCINVAKQCDGFPDCLNESDEIAGCVAGCVLSELRKFLYKDEPVKSKYWNGESISISCSIDDVYDYELEETSTELTCHNGRWVGYIPKCIDIEDSNITSTPKTNSDAITIASEISATQHVLAGIRNYTRSEFGIERDDHITNGSVNTTEKLNAAKECIKKNFRRKNYITNTGLLTKLLVYDKIIL